MSVNVVALSVQNGSAGYTIARRVAEALSFRYFDWEITLGSCRPRRRATQRRRRRRARTRLLRAHHAPPRRHLDHDDGGQSRLHRPIALSLEHRPPEPDLRRLPPVHRGSHQAARHERGRRHRRTRGTARPARSAWAFSGASSTALYPFVPSVTPSNRGSVWTRRRRRSCSRTKTAASSCARVYHFDWSDASNYDITVNTDRFPEEWAIDTIVSAAREMP